MKKMEKYDALNTKSEKVVMDQIKFEEAFFDVKDQESIKKIIENGRFKLREDGEFKDIAFLELYNKLKEKKTPFSITQADIESMEFDNISLHTTIAVQVYIEGTIGSVLFSLYAETMVPPYRNIYTEEQIDTLLDDTVKYSFYYTFQSSRTSLGINSPYTGAVDQLPGSSSLLLGILKYDGDILVTITSSINGMIYIAGIADDISELDHVLKVLVGLESVWEDLPDSLY